MSKINLIQSSAFWVENLKLFKSEIKNVQESLQNSKAEFEQVNVKLNDFDFNKEMVDVLMSSEVFRFFFSKTIFNYSRFIMF